MAHVLVLCVACITAVNWVQTTRSTLYDIDSVRAYWGQAGRLLTQPAEPVRVVEGLSLMQRALGVLKTDYVERGWMTSLGFHQEWALRAALSQQYRAALSARLFPVLLQQLEQALQATKPADQLYEALFVYRMLYEPESRPVYLAFLRHWFLEQTQWTPTYKVLLGGLMDDALMSREVPGDWDGELFVSAQRRVDQATAWSDMMYYDVRIAAQNRLPYHQYHLSMSTHNGLVHAFDDPDFQNKIPFIYTPEGASVFLDMLAAMRNLPTFDAAQVEHIQSLYMRDYTAAWDRLLASLRPKRFQGPSELKAWLDMMLLSSDNPWRALAQTVREQTDVQAPFANHLVRRMRDHFASWHAVVQQEQVWLRLQDDLQALRRAPLAQKSLVLARTAEHVHAFPATLKTWIMDVAQQVAMLPA